ncbi:uncharacterized protein LOC129744536 [Uranotaenia lowii]|uniref:uncharacterized protein LOC129744536 n=1 Tax=Uranotaenia lowii TaxID=190385 RepID=UPI00247A2358|nr:uncharacterized protein LOC129744536 [Uranotaenia lowii]
MAWYLLFSFLFDYYARFKIFGIAAAMENIRQNLVKKLLPEIKSMRVEEVVQVSSFSFLHISIRIQNTFVTGFGAFLSVRLIKFDSVFWHEPGAQGSKFQFAAPKLVIVRDQFEPDRSKISEYHAPHTIYLDPYLKSVIAEM